MPKRIGVGKMSKILTDYYKMVHERGQDLYWHISNKDNLLPAGTFSKECLKDFIKGLDKLDETIKRREEHD